jgi:hypothetical protein
MMVSKDSKDFLVENLNFFINKEVDKIGQTKD